MDNSEAMEKRILLIVGVIMAVTELIKQLLLTFATGGGSYLWWYFPWQLCSIPMYVCIVAGLCRSAKIYRACLAFLSDFGLLAGICAFFDTSGFIYELRVLTIHSYLWHFAMIAAGIYAWTVRARIMHAGIAYDRTVCEDAISGTILQGSVKNAGGYAAFAGALCIYIIGCIVAEIINVSAFNFGCRPINMFYISPKYMMAQIYIRDMVPLIGNGGCIILYIVVTIIGALLIEFLGSLAIWAYRGIRSNA